MSKYSYSKWYVERCNKNKNKINNNFILWVDNVEKKVMDVLKCNLLDLPDEQYFVSFENNISSIDFANYIINENCHLVMNNAYKSFL